MSEMHVEKSSELRGFIFIFLRRDVGHCSVVQEVNNRKRKELISVFGRSLKLKQAKLI